MFRTLLWIAAALLLIKFTAHSQQIHIYNNFEKQTYLGCLTCTKYDANSVWNEYGTYGSKYQSLSIWNRYGVYGSEYNPQSPWNKYSTYPPVLIDMNGRFVGYFTTNTYLQGRTRNKFALWVLDNYEYIMDNYSAVVNELQ
jgi:hypothetical protein